MLTLISQIATGVDAVGIGYDPSDGEIFLYGDSDAVITRVTSAGAPLGTIPSPGGAATRFDLDRADVALDLAGIAVPTGSLLAINGQSGTAEIYALDAATGAVLATLGASFGNNFVVGGAWHAARGTIFLLQAKQASGSANQNVVAEINPATGAVIRSFEIDLTAFTVDFGDLEVDPFSGNLLLVSSDETGIFRVSPEGRYLGQLALPDGIAGAISGIAMNPSVEGEAFISTNTGNVYRIGGLDSFPTYVNLDTLGALDGFGLIGTPEQPGNTVDDMGQAVAGGFDFNGDGFADVMSSSTLDEETGPQEIYVVFGKASGHADIDSATLAPSAGLVLLGPARAQAGFSLSAAGDVNGDGIDDIVIGGYGNPEDPDTGEPAESGRAYVVYGRTAGFGAPDGAGRNVISLSALSPADGYAFFGAPNSQLGFSVSSAGDINGDGLDDVLIGAPQQRYLANGVLVSPQPSAAYVIYGKAGTRESLGVADLLAADGFVIASNGTDDEVGTSVSNLGDLNDDGFDDIVIGAQGGNDGGTNAGEAYVIFGKAGGGFGVTDPGGRDVLALGDLPAGRGFVIQGVADDELGNAVSNAGDINGDGIDDLVVAAVRDDATGGGNVYVIFGSNGGFGTPDGNGRNVLDPNSLTAGQGFRIRTGVNNDILGFDVSSAGDVNGDGFDDLLVSALGINSIPFRPGENYLIFGRANFAATFDPMRMSAGDGVVFQGGDSQDRAGYSLSAAGDVNGDGFDDLIFGAKGDDTGGSNAGQAYVVFGRADWGGDGTPPPIQGTGDNDTLNGTADDDVINGLGGDDAIFAQQGGDDQVIGMEGNDGFYFGSTFTSADGADGGPGIDTLALQGNYPALVLGAGVVNIDVLFTAPGNDTRFGDTAGNSYDYDITTVDANVAAGARLTVIGGYLRPGEDLVFDGSAELDGHFRIFAGRGLNNLTGGAGSDGFYFGADGNWTGTTRVDGGPGIDTIAFRGNYFDPWIVLVDSSFANIEVLAFLSGHTNEYGGFIVTDGFDYDVTTADGNIAAGQRLDVIATTLRENEALRFDARAETDGSLRILGGDGADVLWGGANADILAGGRNFDVLVGGGGADTYLFTSIEDSTGDDDLPDLLYLVPGDGDRIDLSMIDAIAGTSENDAFTFIGDAAFSNVAGQLRAYKVGPDASSTWSVQADVDGDGVPDMIIAIGSTSVPVTASDFVL